MADKPSEKKSDANTDKDDEDDDGGSVEVVAAKKARAPRARKQRLTNAAPPPVGPPPAAAPSAPSAMDIAVARQDLREIEAYKLKRDAIATSRTFQESLAIAPPATVPAAAVTDLVWARENEKRKFDAAFPSAPPPFSEAPAPPPLTREAARQLVEAYKLKMNGNAIAPPPIVPTAPPADVELQTEHNAQQNELRAFDAALPNAPAPTINNLFHGSTWERQQADRAAVDNNKDKHVNVSTLPEQARMVDLATAVNAYNDSYEMLVQQVQAIDQKNLHFCTARDPSTSRIHGFIIKTDALKQSCDAIFRDREIGLLSRYCAMKSPEKNIAVNILFPFLVNSLHPDHDAQVLKVFREISEHCQKYMHPTMCFRNAGALSIHILFRTESDDSICLSNVYTSFKRIHPDFTCSKQEIDKLFSTALSRQPISKMIGCDLIWCPANNYVINGIMYADLGAVHRMVSRSPNCRLLMNPIFGSIGPVEATRVNTPPSSASTNKDALEKEK
jgi:hypothetical protein